MTRIFIQAFPSIMGSLSEKEKNRTEQNKKRANHRGKATLVLVIGAQWRREEHRRGVAFLVIVDKASSSVVTLIQEPERRREEERKTRIWGHVDASRS